MTAAEFADIQEILIIAAGQLASWWLVIVLVASIIMSVAMIGLGFARFLFAKRIGVPQSSNS